MPPRTAAGPAAWWSRNVLLLLVLLVLSRLADYFRPPLSSCINLSYSETPCC